MSKLEDLLYSAHELGIKDDVYKYVRKIRSKYPRKHLYDVYDEAYNKAVRKMRKG